MKSNCKILAINNAFLPVQIVFGTKKELYFSIVESPPVNSLNNILYITDKMLKSFHMNVSDVDAVSVVNGPGSFTGTRIAVVEAKIMSYALSVPLVSLNSLELIGSLVKDGSVVLPAGRKQFFVSDFILGKKIGKDRCVLANKLEDKNIYTTSEKVLETFDKNNTKFVKIDAKLLINLSHNKLEQGKVVRDPLSLVPKYLRSTDIIFRKRK